MHPDRIIPVLFVPGIMGSNLKARDRAKAQRLINVWRPDSRDAVFRVIGMGPATRRAVFDPANLEVDAEISVNNEQLVKSSLGFPNALLKSRGWGTVFWGSYGSFLEYLDGQLNDVMRWSSADGRSNFSGDWGRYAAEGISVTSAGRERTLKLSRDELSTVAKYWYPVHAVGYNWLQSNEQSGKDLARAIDDILEHYRTKWGSKAVKKVILVTHSMGGLVARAAVHPDMGAAADKVLGILHGAMPALGAPAAYKRMRAGNELAGITLNPLSVLKAVGVWAFLGMHGQDVTPILGQSPGGLQLLPNQNYPGDWLAIQSGGSRYPISGNPYATIYRERTKWWRLVNPDWLDPAHASGPRYGAAGIGTTGSDTAWKTYLSCLSEAERFHAGLGDRYHPVTYAFYGADPQHNAWGKIQWDIGTLRFAMRGPFSVLNSDAELKALSLDGRLADDGGYGTVEVRADHASWMGGIRDRFTIREPESKGDGTVPHESGIAPGSRGTALEQFELLGFDHQSAYLTEMENVMAVSKYAIAKIAQKADWGDA
jgi:pimeloyl-ACP methyl ester carboxylesterase